MQPDFVHLRVHSEYSLVDGLVRIKPLVKAVAAAGMPAVALTDQSNLFAMVKFYRAALAAGVKPIIGVDAWLYNPEKANRPHRVILLVQNEAGYRNLTRLVSRSYQSGQRLGMPMMDRAWLKDSCDGLIALSGGREGDVGRALLSGNGDAATGLLEQWQTLFDDRFYLQVERTGRPYEEDCLHATVDLAVQCGAPVVATNDVRFLTQGEFDAHEVRVCIHEGRTLDDSRRPKNYSDQQFLRTPETMQELFADLPEALRNSVEIAKRCNLELVLGKNFLPDFPVPEGMSVDSHLASESRRGLDRRLERIPGPDTTDAAQRIKAYRERLDRELGVITGMGFPGYFLIVADFIRWAKENGIPVGPGRGSGAGSLVAYALGITDLDPLEHELLFERFLNPERVSMPDFDVDFCMERRDRVIDYVAQRYGRDSVSQIITYGSMAARAVVRDVGRVLGHPYGFVDRIAKMVPFEIGMTLKRALEEGEELGQAYNAEEEVQGLIDMAMSLEGIARNAGKHAGGVVIAPGKLTDFAPLYCEPGGDSLVTQFDKDDVEAVGLVKFDFLGLRTLTIIDWATQTINRDRSARELGTLNIDDIPRDDPAAFDLLKRCTTTAVFQLESRGMKELIKRLQPDCFDDITALVALFRPGPLQSGMVDDFINRKHGRAEVDYPHPELEPILKPTHGVILYQEQVMQIAQVLAGYTLGGADLLRRAMGKKKPEEMAKQRNIFVEGAVARGVEKDTAAYIFDLMEKFAGYGFNKSHSAAYALVSYQTAWLKAHYPAAFMAAVLSADMDNTDKVVTLIDECRSIELTVLPPQVNRSDYRFTVAGEDTVVYGLGAIKGVGKGAIDGIIDTRARDGAFTDLFDFCRRIDLRKANRRVLETLIRAGALDELGPNRATLMVQLPLAIKLAEQQNAMAEIGQNDLFGEPARPESALADLPGVAEDAEEWEEEQRLQGEKETLGLYLTGHPIRRYEQEMAKLVTSRIGDLASISAGGDAFGNAGGRGGRRVVVAGLVVGVRHNQTQRGRMGSVILDDQSGRLEAVVFSQAYEQMRDLLAMDKVLVATGMLSHDEFRGGLSLRVEQLSEFQEARAAWASHIRLEIDRANNTETELVARLAETLRPFVNGGCPVQVQYCTAGAEALYTLGDAWRVEPSDELLRRLERLLGEGTVRVVYARARRQETESALAV
jgi:DNA polymerase-3 subunit alpha